MGTRRYNQFMYLSGPALGEGEEGGEGKEKGSFLLLILHGGQKPLQSGMLTGRTRQTKLRT